MLKPARKSVHDKNVDECEKIWNQQHNIDDSNRDPTDDEEEGDDHGEGEGDHFDDDVLEQGIASLTIERTIDVLQKAKGEIENIDVDELFERRTSSRRRRDTLSNQLKSPCDKCNDTDLISRTKEAIALHIKYCTAR